MGTKENAEIDMVCDGCQSEIKAGEEITVDDGMVYCSNCR